MPATSAGIARTDERRDVQTDRGTIMQTFIVAYRFGGRLYEVEIDAVSAKQALAQYSRQAAHYAVVEFVGIADRSRLEGYRGVAMEVVR
jgi:hypothetical protein